MKKLLFAAIATIMSGVLSARTISENTQLTEDTDWSDEVLEIASGVTLDLNGHDLTVAKVIGAGTITDLKTYIPLTYVSSTGSQIVDTGYYASTNTATEFVFTSGGSTTGSGVFFASIWQPQAYMFCYAGGNFLFFGGDSSVCPYVASTRMHLSIVPTSNSNGTLTLTKVENGEVLASKTKSLQNNYSSTPMKLFGSTATSFLAYYTFHSLKFSENGELKRDYIPAKSKDGTKIGIYDKVTRQLQVSGTTTALVAGEVAGSETAYGKLKLAAADGYNFADFTGIVADAINCEMLANGDWSAAGKVMLNNELDLCGKTLTIAGLAGSGKIVDSWKYTPLTYVESTGSQYIKTGYIPGTNTSARFEFLSVNKNSKSQIFFGGKWEYNSWSFIQAGEESRGPTGGICLFGNGNEMCKYVPGSRGLTVVTPAENGYSKVSYTYTSDTEGWTSNAVLTVNMGSTYELGVFAGSNYAQPATVRVYSFLLKEGDEVIRDFVPAKENGKVGLLDRAHNKFYSSNSSTALVGGEELPTAACGAIHFTSGESAPFADFTGTIESEIPMQLTEDLDLTSSAVATINNDIDLNGHTLKVNALAGSGKIYDSKTVQILDKISSWNGTATPRINTGIIPDTTTTIDFDFRTLEPSGGSYTIFGINSWAQFAWLFCESAKGIHFFDGGTKLATMVGYTHFTLSITDEGRAILKNVDSGKELSCASINRKNNDTNGTNKALHIFGRANNGVAKDNGLAIDFYSCQIRQGGELKRDLWPARDNETCIVGMFDKVSGTVLGSINKYSPSAGTKVKTLGKGKVEFYATNEKFLNNWTGTISDEVRKSLEGDMVLEGDADFGDEYDINGTIDPNDHELSLVGLKGEGAIGNDEARKYDFFDYIESTGAQMIKTGYVPNNNTASWFDGVSLNNNKGARVFYGGGWITESYSFVQTTETRLSSEWGDFGFFGGGECFCIYQPNARCQVTVTPGTGGAAGQVTLNITTNGVTKSITKSYAFNNKNCEMGIFGGTNGSNCVQCRFYSFLIKEGDTIIRNFVPAREIATGKIGLLDLEHDKFYADSLSSSTSFKCGTITNATYSTLRVEVPEGTTNWNKSVTLKGNMKLVKEGAGTLIMDKAGQTYSQGTEIVEGEVISGFIQTSLHQTTANKKFLGALGSTITVDEGAVFDVMGTLGYDQYVLVLAGGTLRHSGASMAYGKYGIGSFSLTADSFIEISNSLCVDSSSDITIDLGGHTLDIDVGTANFRLSRNTTFTAGRVVVHGDPSAYFVAHRNVYAKETDFAIGVRFSTDYYTWNIRNYEQTAEADEFGGAATINVYGTFKPTSDTFYPCTMQNGSIIDLTSKTGEWNAVSTYGKALKFASGAAVTLNLAGREVSGKVMGWSALPGDVMIKLDSTSKAAGKQLIFKGDGIYCDDGIIFIVK